MLSPTLGNTYTHNTYTYITVTYTLSEQSYYYTVLEVEMLLCAGAILGHRP